MKSSTYGSTDPSSTKEQPFLPGGDPDAASDHSDDPDRGVEIDEIDLKDCKNIKFFMHYVAIVRLLDGVKVKSCTFFFFFSFFSSGSFVLALTLEVFSLSLLISLLISPFTRTHTRTHAHARRVTTRNHVAPVHISNMWRW